MEEKYEVLRVLGEGAQGKVMLCKERATGTLFACKTSLAHHLPQTWKLASKLFGRKEQQQENIVEAAGRHDYEMWAEIESMRRVQHPSILPVHATFESDDGFLHLLTPFCVEGNLAEKLRAAAAPSTPRALLGDRQAAKVIVCLARALAHSHALGIVHRDVKLENVFVALQRS